MQLLFYCVSEPDFTEILPAWGSLVLLPHGRYRI